MQSFVLFCEVQEIDVFDSVVWSQIFLSSGSRCCIHHMMETWLLICQLYACDIIYILTVGHQGLQEYLLFKVCEESVCIM